MIPLPPPREAPYSLPSVVALDPAYLWPLLLAEVPGCVPHLVDWPEVRRLSRSLLLAQQPDGVRVCLGEPPRMVEGVFRGVWGELRGLLMMAGGQLGATERLALALVCAWQDGSWRPRLDRRDWMRELAVLVDERSTSTETDRGWVRGTLLTAPIGHQAYQAVGGGLLVGLVLHHKRTGNLLPPRNVEGEQALLELLPTATEAERSIARLLASGRAPAAWAMACSRASPRPSMG